MWAPWAGLKTGVDLFDNCVHGERRWNEDDTGVCTGLFDCFGYSGKVRNFVFKFLTVTPRVNRSDHIRAVFPGSVCLKRTVSSKSLNQKAGVFSNKNRH